MKYILSIICFVISITANAQVWENAGLANTAQRNAGYIGGEGGQWLQALAIDNADGMVMLHGSDVGGLWRSTNGGQLWEPANNGYTPRGTCGLFIDPNNPARAISVGSNSGKAAWSNYHGLYLTSDTARSWNQVLLDNNCGYRDIREQIAYDPSSFDTVKGYSMIVYYSRIAWTAGSEGGSGTLAAGLYKSADGGNTWKAISNTKDYGNSIIKIAPAGNYLFVANANGFFRSRNQGISFEKTFSGNLKGMDIFAGDSSKVYICTTNKIYISSDTGVSFTQKTATAFPAFANYLRVSPVDSMCMMTQLNNPADGWNTYYMFSKNGGASWSKTNSDNSMDFLPRNYGRMMYPSWSPVNKDVAFAVGGDFVTKTINGGSSLVYSNNGASAIMSAGVLSFNLDNPSLIFFSAQDYDASISLDSGLTYKYLNMSGNGWGGDIHGGYVVDSLTWFGRSAEGWSNLPCDLKITFNGGVSYQTKGKSGGFSSCFGVYGNRNILFAGDMRSADKGITWTKMTGCDGVITADPSGNHDLYGVMNSSTIVKSADKGATWQAVASLESAINDIAFDHINKEIYASCYTAGLWKVYLSDSSIVDLTSFTPADQYNVRRFSTVAVDPVNPEIVYAGGTRDIYSNDASVMRSTDGGDSWIPLTVAPRHNNSKFGISAGRETSMIRVHPLTRYAWCGSSCFGMWKIGQPETIPEPKPKIRLNQSRIVIKLNDFFQLKATVTNSTDTIVGWKSSNTAKVTVDSTGFITAISPGSANITAKTSLGGLQAVCQVVVSEPKGPYGGSPQLIPGKIEAEAFDLGGEMVSYHDASTPNQGSTFRLNEAVDIEGCGEGGYNVGWTANSEWLSYTTVVDSTMAYDIEIRAAVNAASKINLTFSDGNISTGDISMAATGGWQTWKSFLVKGVTLNKGMQEMRINMVLAAFNLNYVKFTRSIPLQIEDATSSKGLKVYPNPFSTGNLTIYAPTVSNLSVVDIYGANGQLVYSGSLKNGHDIQLERSVFKGGIYLIKLVNDSETLITKLIVP